MEIPSPVDQASAPKVLWSPPTEARSSTRLGEFWDRCEKRSGQSFATYNELWEWSIGSGFEASWAEIWDLFDVLSDSPYLSVVSTRSMPGALWFQGAKLNYAEHALRHASTRPDDIALVGLSQARERVTYTWRELVDQVARTRQGLQARGVGAGDRVAAYLPNVPETVIAFLATSSLGAIWTSCAPEFGVQAVLDRFRQVEPKVLLAVDGYRYGARHVSRVDELAAIRAGLPTVATTVVLPYPEVDDRTLAGPDVDPGTTILWDELVVARSSDAEALRFERVAPEYPLYVLYSSGTTGLPKAIVHGQGTVLIEHLKVLGLHADMNASDRFFWFTTTGWMMWNYLTSGLLLGARLVLFDGDPNAEGPSTLWRLAADEGVTWFGVGAPYITACQRAGLEPGKEFDLSALRAVGSTGAPLPAEGFDWVYASVKSDVMLSPISGGTDICSAFIGGSPLTPVWRGEIPARYLGVAIAAFDESGHPVVNEQGELVVTEPMPSMPVGFWGDTDGSQYRAAYFEDFPGVWRHGDWITITDRGSSIITGRSDATLNRGGVRVGTAEIYRVVEAVDGVTDSLVVHLEDPTGDGPGTLVLFVVLADGATLDDDGVARVRAALRNGLSPRHVPDVVHQVAVIPTTLSGKKLELPVKKILLGADADRVASRGSLKDPTSLDAFIALRSQF